jgi:hypothetical protein
MKALYLYQHNNILTAWAMVEFQIDENTYTEVEQDTYAAEVLETVVKNPEDWHLDDVQHHE